MTNIADITNTSILSWLQENNSKVVDELQQVNMHLATLNGRVEHLEDQDKKRSQQLRGLPELDKRLTVVEAIAEVRNDYQDIGQHEAKAEREQMRSKIGALGVDLAKISVGAGVIGIVVKLLDLLIEKLPELIK